MIEAALAYFVLLTKHCDNPLLVVAYAMLIYVSLADHDPNNEEIRRAATALVAMNFACLSTASFASQWVLFMGHALVVAGRLYEGRHFLVTAYSMMVPHEIVHDPIVAAAHATLAYTNTRKILEQRKKR